MHARDFFPTSRGFRETLTVHPVGCQCAEWCAPVAEPACPTTGDALVSECDCGDFHACPAHAVVPTYYVEPPAVCGRCGEECPTFGAPRDGFICRDCWGREFGWAGE